MDFRHKEKYRARVGLPLGGAGSPDVSAAGLILLIPTTLPAHSPLEGMSNPGPYFPKCPLGIPPLVLGFSYDNELV